MTTPPRTGWPAADKTLVAAVSDRFQVFAATRFPSDLMGIVREGTPVVHIRRIGGTNADRHTDQARVVVDVIAADEDTAEDLAETIRIWLLDTRPIRGGGVLLDGASVEVAPVNANFTDPEVSQYSATYVISSRRISAM